MRLYWMTGYVYKRSDELNELQQVDAAGKWKMTALRSVAKSKIQLRSRWSVGFMLKKR